jgi:hypothetical protein
VAQPAPVVWAAGASPRWPRRSRAGHGQAARSGVREATMGRRWLRGRGARRSRCGCSTGLPCAGRGAGWRSAWRGRLPRRRRRR